MITNYFKPKSSSSPGLNRHAFDLPAAKKAKTDTIMTLNNSFPEQSHRTTSDLPCDQVEVGTIMMIFSLFDAILSYRYTLF